jgi:hypothetical protein
MGGERGREEGTDGRKEERKEVEHEEYQRVKSVACVCVWGGGGDRGRIERKEGKKDGSRGKRYREKHQKHVDMERRGASWNRE